MNTKLIGWFLIIEGALSIILLPNEPILGVFPDIGRYARILIGFKLIKMKR